MPNKRTWSFLVVIIIIFSVILFFQFKRFLGIVIKPSNEPLVATISTNIPINESDQIYGNPGALVTIVEFTDLGCSFCRESNYTIKKIIDAHPQDLRLIWKDAPKEGFFSSGHTLAHQAAYCAGKQNQFWKFTEMVMQDSSYLSEAGLKKVAEALNLNITTWWQCANSKEAVDKIAASAALAQSLGVDTLPTLYINNKKIKMDKDIDLAKILEVFINK